MSAALTDAEGRIDRFGDETVAIVRHALGADWGSFYRIGADLRPFGFRNSGVPHEFGRVYARRAMEQADPLHPVWIVSRKHRFLLMDDVRAENPERHRDLRGVLRSHGAQEAAEMVFRHNEAAIAGLSLVWLQRKPEWRATAALGRSLHSYIEFNLGNLWPKCRVQLSGTVSPVNPCSFTSRELQVIDGVCRGFTNPQIADCLDIGLATVKTHLIHVFKKAGVETRTELIGRLFSDNLAGDSRLGSSLDRRASSATVARPKNRTAHSHPHLVSHTWRSESHR